MRTPLVEGGKIAALEHSLPSVRVASRSSSEREMSCFCYVHTSYTGTDHIS